MVSEATLRKAIDEALRQSLIPEKTCQLLAQKIPQIPLKGFKSTCLKLDSGNRWHIKKIDKEQGRPLSPKN